MVVSIGTIGSAGGAATYYTARENYYTGDEAEHVGLWGGEAAARLGLYGSVAQEAFEAMLEGKLPNGATVANNAGEHHPGIDLTFSMPKSASLLSLVGKDERIGPAHMTAVRATLGWVEQRLAEARIWTDGNRAVPTGNLAYALFEHSVNRNQDPNSHIHAVILNVTQRDDGAWRSLNNSTLFKESTLIGSVYHAFLRAGLEKLGYQTEIVGKHGSFEVKGIDRDTIDQWSTRRSDILAKAAELDIKTPQGLRAVAEHTRNAKQTIEPAKLDAHWQQLAAERGLNLSPLIEAAREAARPRGFIEQVKAWGQALLDRVTHMFGPKPEPLMVGAEPATRGAHLAAAYAVAAGVRHLAEREATFRPNDLLRASLNMAEHGATVREVEARVERLVADRVLLTGAIKGQQLMTTRDILQTETEMVAYVKAGIGNATPPIEPAVATTQLDLASTSADITLSDEQQRAAIAILSGENRVQMIQGDAGAGKTTLFALASEVANMAGIEILAITPQNKLAGELKDTTGMRVQSVEGLLSQHRWATGTPKSDGIDRARDDLGGKILIVDEASMVSHRQMVGLLQLAERSGLAKLVLVGDIKQIDPVEAGRPFALLQRQNLPTEILSKNRRQRDPDLRDAVAALKDGDVRAALDHLGERVKESNDPAKAAAKQWLGLSESEREQTALLTSGHKLREQVLDNVRAGLVAEGRLGSEAHILQTFDNLNLTTQQLKQLSSYAPGQLFEVFRYQPSINLAPGRYEVRGIDPDTREVEVAKDGTRQRFDPSHLSSSAKGLALKVPSEIEVRQGDKLIWTTNDKANGITNGTSVEVQRIDAQQMILGNDKGEWSLKMGDQLSQNLAHGLVLNMHRAQGMTYDRTISVIDSQDKLLNSASLFYVLNSRAREDSAIHLDDKDAVARSIEQHRGATPNAMDLAPELHTGGNRGSTSNSIDTQLDKSLARATIEILGLAKVGEPDIGPDTATKKLTLKITEPTPTKTYDFEMEM